MPERPLYTLAIARRVGTNRAAFPGPGAWKTRHLGHHLHNLSRSAATLPATWGLPPRQVKHIKLPSLRQ